MKKLLFLLAGLAFATLFVACPSPEQPNSEPGTVKDLKSRINSAKENDVIDLGEEPITVADSDSYTITKPLTIKNGNAKNGTFVVQSKGVKFENVNKVDAVIVGEKVADGEFTLSNCYNVGEVYVNGGGSKSVHIANTQITKLTVNKKNVRIALDDDKSGSTAIGKVFVLQDCKLESDKKDNSFGSVVVAETVKTLDLAGSAAIKEIVSTAEKELGNADIKINVTANVVIEAVDNTLSKDNFTAVDSEGNEATGTDAFDTSKINFEDKAVAKEEAKEEIATEVEKVEEQLKPTYTIDLTEAFGVSKFSIDEYAGWSYTMGIDITKRFNGKLPKKGDVIEFILEGKFSNKIDVLLFQLFDTTKDWYRLCNDGYVDLKANPINANEPVKLTKKVEIVEDAVGTITARFFYSNTIYDGTTLFTPKDWKGTIKKINADSIIWPTRFIIDTNDYKNYKAEYNVTPIFNPLPNEGDVYQVVFKGKFDRDLANIRVDFNDLSPAAGYYRNLTGWRTGAYTGIKADKEFEFNDFFIIKNNAEASVTMRVVYTAKDDNGNDIGDAEFTSGDFDNRKKFPADFSGGSGGNTVILSSQKNENGNTPRECPFTFKGSDLDLNKWYKITYKVKSSFVRDETKQPQAYFKVSSWHNETSKWLDYVTSVEALKIGEEQTIEYYVYLENPVDYLSPECEGYNVVVTYDSITIEEAPDYVPPKANYEDFMFRGMANGEDDSYMPFIYATRIEDGIGTFTYKFEKDFDQEISILATKANAGKLKINSMTIDGKDVVYKTVQGCSLKDGIVKWTDEWARLEIDNTKAKKDSILVIVFECL